MAEDDADERRDRNQRAVAAAAGAALGSVIAGPAGAAAGAALGPMLEPLVRGVCAQLSESARQRQVDVLFSAIHAGIPVDELEERINTSGRTQLLAGIALSAATRTAWEDKVRTLGRSLASGLLADDNAKIDTEQMIIGAITDIEGPQLAMLELLVHWEPGRRAGGPPVEGPLDVLAYSYSRSHDGSWQVNGRKLNARQIAFARPSLAPITPSLLGTLQRHGLVVQNDNTSEAIERHQEALERAIGRQRGRPGVPTVNRAGDLAPDPTWSPTELGEQVFLRFRDGGTELPEVWASGLADQQQLRQSIRAYLHRVRRSASSEVWRGVRWSADQRLSLVPQRAHFTADRVQSRPQPPQSEHE